MQKYSKSERVHKILSGTVYNIIYIYIMTRGLFHKPSLPNKPGLFLRLEYTTQLLKFEQIF